MLRLGITQEMIMLDFPPVPVIHWETGVAYVPQRPQSEAMAPGRSTI